jgi:hypothetical protein
LLQYISNVLKIFGRRANHNSSLAPRALRVRDELNVNYRNKIVISNRIF